MRQSVALSKGGREDEKKGRDGGGQARYIHSRSSPVLPQRPSAEFEGRPLLFACMWLGNRGTPVSTRAPGG